MEVLDSLLDQSRWAVASQFRQQHLLHVLIIESNNHFIVQYPLFTPSPPSTRVHLMTGKQYSEEPGAMPRQIVGELQHSQLVNGRRDILASATTNAAP
jgi:hypothetical protein